MLNKGECMKKISKYTTLSKAAKIIGIDEQELIDFLFMKKYIYKCNGKWRANVMSIKFGYCRNLFGRVMLTVNCICKVSSAFAAWNSSVEEGRKLVEKYGLCI